jgi:DNA transformation protein and related proteins
MFRHWCAFVSRWWVHREPDPERLRVIRMRNINAKTSSWLEEIGIRTRADLVRIGALEAYRQLLASGLKPSSNLLLALHGAIIDCDWQLISEKQKAYLRDEARAFQRPSEQI